MSDVAELLESFVGSDLSSTARLVAVLEHVGITDREGLEKALDAKPSTIRAARQALKNWRQNSSARILAPENERERQKSGDDRQNSSDAPEIQRQNSGASCAPTCARNESPSGIVITSVGNISPPTPSEPETEASESEVIVNGTAIKGPWFKLDYAAIDIVASLAGMSSERGRQIAEVCARDWVANNIRPSNPMAMVRSAITSDKNQAAIHEVRLGRAAEDPVVVADRGGSVPAWKADKDRQMAEFREMMAQYQ